MTVLSAEELLAGGNARHTIAVPAHLGGGSDDEPLEVVVRPLLLADVVRLHQASGTDEQLGSVLMVQQALVDPRLSVDQVHRLPAGLVEFLLGEVNRVSGLTMTADDLEALVHQPLARACVILAREFGWTPERCAELTIGQVLLYVEMADRGERP